jgi:hypothetical protein
MASPSGFGSPELPHWLAEVAALEVAEAEEAAEEAEEVLKAHL